jgi:redox-sensitive bicupin YhaK (pirin superfamily)
MNIFESGSEHWVGDGFPVRNLFPSTHLGFSLSPFLLLDYAGPHSFPPSAQPRGVGEHPHRGFETVTIVYQGGVSHRDSAGHAGTIGPGDVQWMTAAGGIVHEEMQDAAFTRQGGTLQMAQLWVNLPKVHKMSQPGYQGILDADIPRLPLEQGGSIRVIAGEWNGVAGPAKTFTPLNVWDLRLPESATWEWQAPPSYNTAAVLLEGVIECNGETVHGPAKVIVDRSFRMRAIQPSTVLLLSGEPINEPIANYGPFVMNTREEILQAMEDYRAGKMGRLAPSEIP